MAESTQERDNVRNEPFISYSNSLSSKCLSVYFHALRYTQDKLNRSATSDENEAEAHISGEELLSGIREFALEQFGLMTQTVFSVWGIESTDDFGRMVFELIERGEMRKPIKII